LNIVFTSLYLLATIIFWVAVAGASLFLLRMILTWANVNPFSRIPYHLTQFTERMVAPLRFQLGGRLMRYDFVPLIAAAIVLVTGLFIANTLREFASILNTIYNIAGRGIMDGTATRVLIGQLVLLLGISYGAILFLRILLPYFGVGYRSSFMRFAYKITEPLLKPLRRFFVFGMVDFSAWIALIIVQFGTQLIANAIMGS
jgi:uncharacterized protein YggT (Ycf19 family)